MKRVVFLFLIIIECMVGYGQYVTLVGRQFKDENGNNFYPLVCNYLVNIVNADSSDFSTTYISPQAVYDGNGAAYECNTTSICNEQLANNFLQIMKLGFNCVRIMGLCPTFITEGKKISCSQNDPYIWECKKTGLYIETSPHSLDSCKHFTRFELSTPGVQNKLFEHILNLLTVLAQTKDPVTHKSLKAILITVSTKGYFSSGFPDAYNVYLDSLSHFITTHATSEVQQSILAYDLQNEPASSFDSLVPLKQEICRDFTMWYYTVKTNEPHRLLTLGVNSFYNVFNYDPEILHLDFYSPHIYSEVSTYGQDSTYDHILTRTKGNFFWLKNNVQMPWMVGETGFRAHDGTPYKKMIDGTEKQQKQYADTTLPLTYNCIGSGYSWWQYQDEGSTGTFWGTLRYGYCSPPCTSLYKPVDTAFMNFIVPQPPCNCPQPAKYNDPFYHAENAPGTYILNGYVKDQNGNPVKDAVVFGWVALRYDYSLPSPSIAWDRTYTFTDSTGFFALIPYDYDTFSPNFNTIELIGVSAPGFSTTWQGNLSGRDHYILYHNGNSITLSMTKLSDFNYSASFSNFLVTAGYYLTFQAWNDVTVSNGSILSGGSSDIQARQECNVLSEFLSEYGSETWIHTAETFLPCEYVSNSPVVGAVNQISSPDKAMNVSERKIALHFNTTKDYVDFEIYPNPTSGIFTIELLQNCSYGGFTVEICDLFSKEVFTAYIFSPKTTIDLSFLDDGTYFVLLKKADFRQTKKIVLIK